MKHKRPVYYGYSKRTIILTIALFCSLFFGLGYSLLATGLNLNGDVDIDKYDNTLYGAFKRETKSNSLGLASVYTGAHKDSFTENGNEPIYHWSSNSSMINERNNVLFAGHCWQMYRTTDTGGVKLLYNGIAENNECLTNRPTHMGYAGKQNSFNLYDTYYYGTDYIYDEETALFSLSGTITTGEVKLNQYTCALSTPDGTCSTIYYGLRHYGWDMYYTLQMNSNVNYSLAGSLPYSLFNDSVSYIGYMNDTEYRTKQMVATSKRIYTSNTGISGNTYYSDSITYDSSSGQYVLVDPHQVSELDDINDLVGKYTVLAGGTSGFVGQYVLTVTDSNRIYYYRMEDGDLNTSLTIGDSFIDNGNGTYTVNNSTVYSFADWYNGVYSSYNYVDFYFCLDSSNTCNEVWFDNDYQEKNNIGSFKSSEHLLKYAENVSYQNGVYTLSGDVKTIFNWRNTDNQEIIKSHHYFCTGGTNTCSTVNYIIQIGGSYLYYVTLSDGKNATTALESMISSNTVNTNDSILKFGVDKWFEDNLIGYDSYLEDTIFCNDRSIQELGSWNPNGGNMMLNYNYIYFNSNGQFNYDLSCTNVTDQFSVNNSKAKLKYKVGLITLPEINLLNSKNFLHNGVSYWTLTPQRASDYTTLLYVSGESNRYILSGDSNYSYGFRPVISLKPGTKIDTGIGTVDEPYIVNAIPTSTDPNLVRLVVNYWDTTVGSNIMAPSVTKFYNVGDSYNITSPTFHGFTANNNNVTGTITSDTTINVIYSRNSYTYTINYLYEDDTQAAESQVLNITCDSPAVMVTSPTIEGYYPSDDVVYASILCRYAENSSYTVHYSTEPYIDIPS